jgi:fructosamine-3-kinase
MKIPKIPSDMKPAIRSILENRLGSITETEVVHGGSINQCFRVTWKGKPVFCKTNSVSAFPGLFEKEKQGLDTLKAHKILTPAVFASFIENDHQFLVLEWVEQGTPNNDYRKKLGETLASLHLVSNPYFGLDHDNYMGSVPQENERSDNWTEFYIQRRLLPVIEKCSHLLDKKIFLQFESLFKKLPEIYPDKKPSLLHGDLWNGNLLCNKDLEPVLIDPAVYYGHHSIDIGMTKLFGGFHHSFLDAYKACIPVDPDFSEQCEISNLYPLLIHLFLFGGHYRGSIAAILKKYTD